MVTISRPVLSLLVPPSRRARWPRRFHPRSERWARRGRPVDAVRSEAVPPPGQAVPGKLPRHKPQGTVIRGVEPTWALCDATPLPSTPSFTVSRGLRRSPFRHDSWAQPVSFLAVWSKDVRARPVDGGGGGGSGEAEEDLHLLGSAWSRSARRVTSQVSSWSSSACAGGRSVFVMLLIHSSLSHL